jgi:anthranilate 1,2-dioxygenase small subunit
MLEMPGRTEPRREDARAALLDRLLLREEVDAFNAAYAAALDGMRLSDWARMFTDDGFYVVISRENHDRNRPVGLIYCEGIGMIRDRAFALEKTAMFAPRYLRHMVANTEILGPEVDGIIRSRSNYLVLQVLFDRPEATLHQLGRYEDVFRRVDGMLRLASRRCIYDSLLVANALCVPV